MTKKEYILKVLDKVIPYRPKAFSLKQKVLSPNITQEYIEDIYQKCIRAVHTTFLHQLKIKQSTLKGNLQYLQKKELLSKELDQNDIDNFEQLFLDIG